MRASGGSTLPISGRQLALALIRLVAIGAVVVLAVVEIAGLGAIRARLGGADIGWMALAAALELGSVFAFALALHANFACHLERRLSCALGVTAQAVNALAPAGGTTGITAAGVLLRRTGLAAELVTARSVGLFVLTGLATNVLLIVVGGVGAATGVLPSGLSLWALLAPALVAVVLLVAPAAAAVLLYHVVASLVPLGLGAIGAPAAVRWTSPGAAGRPYALSGSTGSAPS